MSWALLNLGVQSGHHEFIAASLEGLRWERSKISGSGWSRPANTKDGPQSTWCHGAAGIALSRMAMLKIYQSQDLLDDADNSVKATLASKWPESHGLCHGVLGNLETLRDAMSLWPEDDSIASKYNSVTLKLKEDLALGVYKTSLPAYQSGPGLMLGLSGVGLGLLRLFSPELIPNVLVMES
ncbi:MAG: hypothetical protein NTV34_13000 [Proteobacteria bacterium]|nr:hypothetical protein [Pseudomonadota bacterium]